MKYTIRRVEESDKDFLLELRKITMNGYLEKAGIVLSEEEHMDRILYFFDNSYIIESEQGYSIGLLKYIEDNKTLELVQLQILPEFQGRGIGTEILEELITKAKQYNQKFTLKVLKNNPSKFLYERLGLKVMGEDDIEYLLEYV